MANTIAQNVANLQTIRDNLITEITLTIQELTALDQEAALLAAGLPDAINNLQSTASPDYTVSGGGGTQSFGKGALLSVEQQGQLDALRTLNQTIDTFSKKLEMLQRQLQATSKTLNLIQPYAFVNVVR